MIVELAGPVGAGKSAVAGLLPEALAARGISASHIEHIARLGRPRRYLWNARFAITHPGLVWMAWRAVAGAPIPGWHRRLIFGLFLSVGGRIAYARRRVPPGRLVLVDEGLVHRAVNLYGWYAVPPLEAVARYVGRVTMPDILIAVDADADEAAERARARGVPKRLVGRSDGDVQAFVAQARSVALAAIDAAADRPNVAVIRVRNRQSLRRAVGDAARALVRVTGASAAAARKDVVWEPRWPTMPRPDRVASRLRVRRSGSLSAAQLRRVLDRYGAEPTGRPRTLSAPRARGAAVRVATTAGELVIKRYKPSLDPAAIAIEHAILGALEHLDVAAPRARRTSHGETSVSVDGACFAVYDAIDGYRHPHEVVMAGADRRRFETIAGRLLATLHLALEDVEVPPSSSLGFVGRDGARVRDVAWHATRLGDAPAPRRVRAWVEGALWRLWETFDAEGLPRAVVHGDYAPYNLLIRPGAVPVIVDFELARLDWRLVDLATGLAWFGQRRRGFDVAAARRVLDGYRESSMATEDELRRIPEMAAFLALQRAAVAWSRANDGEAEQWGAEGRRRVLAAEDLLAGRHPLNAVVRRR